jgi:putative ABC transport system substrate-binding protein
VGAAAAPFVDSILKGAKPADLPAQEVPKVVFALSLKRAAELGITVPDDVITQADVVYP